MVVAYRVNFILGERTEQDTTLLQRIANCFEISRIKLQKWADAASNCSSEPAEETHC